MIWTAPTGRLSSVTSTESQVHTSPDSAGPDWARRVTSLLTPEMARNQSSFTPRDNRPTFFFFRGGATEMIAVFLHVPFINCCQGGSCQKMEQLSPEVSKAVYSAKQIARNRPKTISQGFKIDLDFFTCFPERSCRSPLLKMFSFYATSMKCCQPDPVNWNDARALLSAIRVTASVVSYYPELNAITFVLSASCTSIPGRQSGKTSEMALLLQFSLLFLWQSTVVFFGDEISIKKTQEIGVTCHEMLQSPCSKNNWT